MKDDILIAVYLRQLIEPGMTLAAAVQAVEAESALVNPAPAPVDNAGTPAVIQAEAVEAHMVSLKENNAPEFERLRKRPYVEQVAAANAAP